jgi:predicted O-methyltransferase YrrM
MQDYEFTSDWFSHNRDEWENISKNLHAKFGSDLTCLEVGVWEGRSAIYTLDNLVGAGEMYAIDYFKDQDVRTRYYDNIARNPRHSQITTLEGPSFIELAKLLETMSARFHHIYIDAAKISTSNICNLILAEGLLIQGGIMTVDDYLWNDVRDTRFCPRSGIDTYRGLTILCDVISEGYHISFKRNSTPNYSK